MPATSQIERAVEMAGGEEEVELKLRRFSDDVRYLQSIRQELLRKYLNHWIAVYENSLAAYARNTGKLRKQLLSKGIPENEAVIEFMAGERKAMLL